MADMLKRLRVLNLVMIGLIQYLIHYTLIAPFLAAKGGESSLTPPVLFILVLSGICIAAGGYLVNDLNDRDVDAINKAGSAFNPRLGRFLYLAFTFTGIAAGLYLSFVKMIPLVWKVNLLAALALYVYAGPLRRWKAAGNLLVAALVVMAMLIVWLADQNARTEGAVRTVLYGYCFFAFMMTWTREIIKDMEDVDGDRLVGKLSLPVLAGMRFAGFSAVFILLIVLFSLALLQYMQRQWEDRLSFLYIVILIQGPLAVLIIGTLRASAKAHYARLSALAKAVMVTGMLSMLAFHLLY